MTRWADASARLVRGPDVEQLTFGFCVALLDGDLDRADEITDEIARIEGAHPNYSKALRFDLGNIRGRLTNPNVLRAIIASRPVERGFCEAVIARVLARTGRTDEACRLIGEIRARGYLPPTSARWAMTMSCLSEAAVLCGDVDVAADVAGLLLPLAGRWLDSGPGVWDTVDRARALCLLTLGEPETAAELARAAAATSARQATPILRARELVVLAAAEAARGRPSDDALREALAISHRTGAHVIERRPAAAPERRPSPSRPRLRQRVIDHVAQGGTTVRSPQHYRSAKPPYASISKPPSKTDVSTTRRRPARPSLKPVGD
jgi:pentatricopeptide repeat protein